jgi:hypothetical protein
MLTFVCAGQQNKNTEYLSDNNNEIGLEMNAGREKVFMSPCQNAHRSTT